MGIKPPGLPGSFGKPRLGIGKQYRGYLIKRKIAVPVEKVLYDRLIFLR